MNKLKNNNRNKSYKIIRSRKLLDKEIKLIDNNKNNINNRYAMNNNNDINNNLHILRNQRLKFNPNENPNQIQPNQKENENIKSTIDTQDNYNKNKFKTISSEEQKTNFGELDSKNRRKLSHKLYKTNKTNINIFSDPMNPYLTNWAKSFLKLGFNAGIWANKKIDGVPILRIQKLRPKLEFPPIYKIKYNQFSKLKNSETFDNEESKSNNKKIYNNKYCVTSTNFTNNKKNEDINLNTNNDIMLEIKYMNVDDNNRTINVSKNI